MQFQLTVLVPWVRAQFLQINNVPSDKNISTELIIFGAVAGVGKKILQLVVLFDSPQNQASFPSVHSLELLWGFSSQINPPNFLLSL